MRPTLALFTACSIALTGCYCPPKPIPPLAHPPATAEEPSRPPNIPSLPEAVKALKDQLAGIDLNDVYRPDPVVLSCGSKPVPLVLYRQSIDAKVTLQVVRADDTQTTVGVDKVPVLKVGLSGKWTGDTKGKTTDSTTLEFGLTPRITDPHKPVHPDPKATSDLGRLVKAAEDAIVHAPHSEITGPCMKPVSVETSFDYSLTYSDQFGWSANVWLASGGQTYGTEHDHAGTILITIKYGKRTPNALEMAIQ